LKKIIYFELSSSHNFILSITHEVYYLIILRQLISSLLSQLITFYSVGKFHLKAVETDRSDIYPLFFKRPVMS